MVSEAHHVHFTRARAGSRACCTPEVVKARLYLPEDARVKHVYEENASDRSRDLRWHGYINLSVTDINVRMFEFVHERSIPCDKWVILGFDPDRSSVTPGGCVLHHEQRLRPRIPLRRSLEDSSRCSPRESHGATIGSVQAPATFERRNQTTDPQAEVLYPFELSLDHLGTVTVADEDTYETVQGGPLLLPPRSRSRHQPGGIPMTTTTQTSEAQARGTLRRQRTRPPRHYGPDTPSCGQPTETHSGLSASS